MKCPNCGFEIKKEIYNPLTGNFYKVKEKTTKKN